MSKTDAVIVDIGSLVRTVERESTIEITAEIYELWFAKSYSKAHAIPCVSANIVTSRPRDYRDMVNELSRIVDKYRFDPVEMLPMVPWRGDDRASIWMYVRNKQLMMSTSRAIKSCWGDLYHRFS